MEMRIASTARADLDDIEDVGSGHARMSVRMGWAGACMITYPCASERVHSGGSNSHAAAAVWMGGAGH
jgi:hypothetical protein